MIRPIKCLLIITLTVLFFACTMFPTKESREISKVNLQKIQLNTSTKSEVQALVGKPKKVTTFQTAEGTRNLWTYLQLAIDETTEGRQATSHTIMFNERDVVIGITTTKY